MGNKGGKPEEEEVVEEEIAAPPKRESLGFAPGVGGTAVLGVHGTRGRASIVVQHTDQEADVEVNPLEWARFQADMEKQFAGKGSLLSGMIQLRVENGKFWRARFVFLNNCDHMLHIFSFDHDADAGAMAMASVAEDEDDDGAPQVRRASSATGIIAADVGGASHEKIPLSTIAHVDVEGDNTFVLLLFTVTF